MAGEPRSERGLLNCVIRVTDSLLTSMYDVALTGCSGRHTGSSENSLHGGQDAAFP